MATSKEYMKMVADETGWATVPPGTRKSLYDNPEYQAAPFAAVTLKAMQTADRRIRRFGRCHAPGCNLSVFPSFNPLGPSWVRMWRALAGA